MAMYNSAVTVRRIDVLIRILRGRNRILGANYVNAYCSDAKVTIGDVSKEIKTPDNIQYVPRKYLPAANSKLQHLSQSTLRNLRWMMQKDSLGQDMFLLGRPGPSRRNVALQYLELTQREMEYVALSRDTTEADLKQRREIQNSTAKYFDQSAVRAAVEGRVLVLEGIEKAERNVLPVLNNLLENREMHLEDGRFLVPASRYDKLLQEHGEEELCKWRLVRVDENFRVIALGLPVPRYSGQPLDPPLRSRFQARDVANIAFGEHMTLLKEEAPRVDVAKLEQLLSAAYALISPELQQISLPDFPVDSLRVAALILEQNPNIPIHKLFYFLYPYNTFLSRDHVKNVQSVLENLKIDINPEWSINMQGVEFKENQALVTMEINGAKSQFGVTCGERSKKGIEDKGFVKTEYQSKMLNELMLSHSVGDFCIIGPKGCGKSLLITQLASLLGYTIEPIVLYQDMTARDLVQQRTTLDNGDTVWRNSALVDAALKGRMAVLDGLHRIHPSTLAVLHRLVQDRELQLHDGTRLLRHDRYDELLAAGLSQQQLEASGVKRIHPAFRIVALGEPPALGRGQHWLSPEILCLFVLHEMRNLSKNEEISIINSLYGDISQPLHSIINLADELRSSDDSTLKSLSSSLSTRQLLRIASRMSKYPSDSAYETVQRTFLAKFLPNLARRALDGACRKIGIEPKQRFGLFGNNSDQKKVTCSVHNGVLTIGQTSTEVHRTDALTKVPDILFYDVPQHVQLLEWLLQDFLLGNHLLLVGNQGVGKNKIADRLLQLLNRPREYIQLHRDTTVQSLTVQPTVRDGVVIYEDSPLVKAVKYGHVLVVDEADKAPTHVTCILKTLVENGEMILSDGRRIVPQHMLESSGGDVESFIPVHDDFRMIVLANRPGFPFLGNDFFAALGDLFSCHAVDNPSVDSEMELLRSYGPDVPRDVMNKLVQAFAVLRDMADQGQLTYPYSTRELVNIIKHLQKYPGEDLASAIGNVFDFDRYSDGAADALLAVLHASGLPTGGVLQGRPQDALKRLQLTIERTSGKDVSSPKHGKEDPDNKPHVGGNTWAGGTGGRDTAGLGGKGGPYRLDKGHDVHQLSDAEKEDIPEHVRQAAREMNRKAFEERLREINMSEYDAKLYEQFLRAVQPQIGALRGVLAELQAKRKERQWTRHQTSGELDDAKIIEEQNPNIPIHKLFYFLYPYNTFLSRDHVKNVQSVLENLKIDINPEWSINMQGVEFKENQALVTMEINGAKSQFGVTCGERSKKGIEDKGFVKTEYQSKMLNELMLSHSVGDFCIIGPKGCGKSLLITQLASLLGYTIEPIVLYQDMTARDLVQQRTTLDNGDTVWRNSALVDAALKGRMAVLDGLHRIHPSTLAVLHRLVQDRELQLHDGTRLLRHDRYDELLAAGLSQQQLEASGVKRIHPAFRIVALGEPPALGRGQHWLSPEILCLFVLHEMRNLSKNEEISIINSLYGDISQPLHSIINLADELRSSDDSTLKSLSSSLSTRQLLRIASRMSKYPSDSAYETVQRTFLAKFLPNLARRALDGACRKIGIEPKQRFGLFGNNSDQKKVTCSVHNGVLTIGQTSTEVHRTDALTKVPDILFYDVPQHVQLLEWLLQDFLLGNHLLLVGNQGVGKNKIADRLLQLLNRPREYIQLHRDTTVQSLTVQPTVRDGVVIYEDSPLVKAVKYGHVLVVDEADKAPTHVTCILKTLVENGEMILSDGRRIVPQHMLESSGGDVESFIPVHDDFRMIVLANRPGFPFLGNDFFAALGDLFSCHAVDNPSVDSEMELLRSYGPDVPRDVMNKLVQAFAVLRDMADQGQLTYPYSTRELVNIIKHLQKYPGEDLASAIGNVFDFDRYSDGAADALLAVLHASGLPTGGVLQGRPQDALKRLQLTIERTSGKDVSSPKHGKEDPDNKPHVGGNTWAGGTGGRDTAGLGGKGGPYRLDKGHDVHQLSDAEKEDIPEHVRQAAREMNRKAFEERLREINMSEYDAKLYEQFLRAVQPQIGALRGVLAELQAKRKERQWTRHQTSGELDDAKIIEGLTGERGVYRRRTEQPPLPGAPPDRPKRLRVVLDVSGSMYRFNSYDGRLERSMEAVVLLTEALRGHEARIRYDLLAHSGEERALELVRVGSPPRDEKQRLQIIRTMHAHAQFCWSGDNTLPAAKHAIATLAEEDADEAIVLILSDANLRRYGIRPEELGAILTSDHRVQAHVIFIGSLGDEANSLLRRLPAGHAHVCMDVASLPQIMQQIFASSLLQGS